MSSKITIYQYTNFVDFGWRFLDKTDPIEFTKEICFSNLTGTGSSNLYDPKIGIEVAIKIYTIPKKSGYCVLTFEEMKMWLDEIQQWIDFNYTLEVNEEGYLLTFTTHITMKAILVLLTLIRFSFESPFNLCLKEAFVLTEKSYFPDLLLLYKYQLVQNSLGKYTNYHHCICKFEKIPLLTIEQLKKRMINYDTYVNNLFNKTNSFGTGGDVTKFKKVQMLNDKSELDISDEAVAKRVEELYNPNFIETYEQT